MKFPQRAQTLISNSYRLHKSILSYAMYAMQMQNVNMYAKYKEQVFSFSSFQLFHNRKEVSQLEDAIQASKASL